MKGNITLPKSLKIIGEWSFRFCFEITSFIFPETLELIGSGAFERCNNFSGPLILPDSVKSIGGDA